MNIKERIETNLEHQRFERTILENKRIGVISNVGASEYYVTNRILVEKLQHNPKLKIFCVERFDDKRHEHPRITYLDKVEELKVLLNAGLHKDKNILIFFPNFGELVELYKDTDKLKYIKRCFEGNVLLTSGVKLAFDESVVKFINLCDAQFFGFSYEYERVDQEKMKPYLRHDIAYLSDDFHNYIVHDDNQGEVREETLPQEFMDVSYFENNAPKE